MLGETARSSKTKRMLFGLMLLALLCGAIVLGFAHRISQCFAGSADAPARNERARTSDKLKFVEPPPQTSAQFDLSRNVIAGGGGTSSGGNLGLSGTNGQASAGTTSGGGQFTVTGGFWQPETGVPPTPRRFQHPRRHQLRRQLRHSERRSVQLCELQCR